MATPSRPAPYQPSLLRLLHGVSAALLALAWLSGLEVYSSHDGRWGRLPWRLAGDWIDIHGSIGVLLWPLALLFGYYALTIGRPRLRHPANAVALAALALAVGSGKLMQEDWLRQGQFSHPVYAVHLLAWLLIPAAMLAHLAGVLRRGGMPLAASMASLTLRSNDGPGQWPRQLLRPWRSGR
ncbi:MAG: cytochrome b/b6 domain-containing protein [Cyanobium sp.]